MTKKRDEIDGFDELDRQLNAAMGIVNALFYALISSDVDEKLLGKAAYAALEHLESAKDAVRNLDAARMARDAAAEKGGAS